jgi:hypothetical protein
MAFAIPVELSHLTEHAVQILANCYGRTKVAILVEQGHLYYYRRRMVEILLELDLLILTESGKNREKCHEGRKIAIPVSGALQFACWVAPTVHERQSLGNYLGKWSIPVPEDFAVAGCSVAPTSSHE